jgi:hypothetical protein
MMVMTTMMRTMMMMGHECIWGTVWKGSAEGGKGKGYSGVKRMEV